MVAATACFLVPGVCRLRSPATTVLMGTRSALRGLRHLLTVLQGSPGATAVPPSVELMLATAAAARSGGADLASVSLDWPLPFTAVFQQHTSADRLPSTLRMRQGLPARHRIQEHRTQGLLADPPPAFRSRWRCEVEVGPGHAAQPPSNCPDRTLRLQLLAAVHRPVPENRRGCGLPRPQTSEAAQPPASPRP